MELEKQANLVGDIRAELMDRINTRLKVRANMGRSKIVECEGTLMQAHPALFVVEVDRKRGRKERRGRTARQSYQYVDILTGMVELFDAETKEPIFGKFMDDETEENAATSALEMLLSDDLEDDGDDDL